MTNGLRRPDSFFLHMKKKFFSNNNKITFSSYIVIAFYNSEVLLCHTHISTVRSPVVLD